MGRSHRRPEYEARETWISDAHLCHRRPYLFATWVQLGLVESPQAQTA